MGRRGVRSSAPSCRFDLPLATPKPQAHQIPNGEVHETKPVTGTKSAAPGLVQVVHRPTEPCLVAAREAFV
jgi:hypothetical protein